MATLYLIDFATSNGSSVVIGSSNGYHNETSVALPLGWRCAAELAQCGSAAVAAELWRTTSPSGSRASQKQEGDHAHERDDTSFCTEDFNSTFALTPFPVAIDASNRYFTTRVEAVVGSFGRKGRWREPGYERPVFPLENALRLWQPHMARCEAFGCVFVVRSHQSPEDVPWHLVPQSTTSLFCAVLVVYDNSRSLTERRGEEEVWKAACVANRFEWIPWQLSAVSQELQPVGDAARNNGLLGATLTGSARVMEILCNTLWPPQLRSSVATRPPQTSHIKNTALSNETREENRVIVIAGGSEEYKQDVWRSFTLPGWRMPAWYEGEGDVMWADAMASQDVRFFAHLSSDSTGGSVNDRDASPHQQKKKDHPSSQSAQAPHAPSEINRSSTMSCATIGTNAATKHEDTTGGKGGNHTLHLVNRYVSAQVRPTFLHAALFDTTTTDLVRRQLEQQLSSVTQARDAPRAATGGSESDGAALPVLLYWPPDGRHTVSTSDGFAYPPLTTILRCLRGLPSLVGPITVVSGATAANMVGAREVPVADRARRDRFQRCYHADRLTPAEAQACEEISDVEVVFLLPQDGLMWRKKALEATSSTPPACYELIYRRPRHVPVPEEVEQGWSWASVEGASGADRLREILHSWPWPHTCPTAASVAEEKLSATQNAKQCTNALGVYAFGFCAEEEEALLQHALSYLLSFRDKEAARETKTSARAPRLNGVPSLCCHGCVFPVVSKYCTTEVSVQILGGGVRGRLGLVHRPSMRCHGNGDDQSSFCPFEEVNAVVVLSTKSTLSRCASLCRLSPVDRSDQDNSLIAFAELLRAAQSRLSQDWQEECDAMADATTGELQKAAAAAAEEEFLFLLYLVDLPNEHEDEEAWERARTDLHTILFAHTNRGGDDSHTSGSTRSTGACDGEEADATEAEVDFPLVEIVTADRIQGTGSVTTMTTPSDACANAVPTSGCCRIAEALEQHAWPRYEEHLVQGVPRPSLHKQATGVELSAHAEVDAVDATRDVKPCRREASDKTEKEDVTDGGDTSAEGCEAVSPNIGCDLPDHFLVDPVTLRSEPVAALLYFQSKGTTMSDTHGATTSRTSEAEERFQVDLMAWVDKMKVYGHKLPHQLRKDQAAKLAMVMEHIL